MGVAKVETEVGTWEQPGQPSGGSTGSRRHLLLRTFGAFPLQEANSAGSSCGNRT